MIKTSYCLPLAIHDIDPDATDEERFIAVGMGNSGLLLVVVYVLKYCLIIANCLLKHRKPSNRDGVVVAGVRRRSDWHAKT